MREIELSLPRGLDECEVEQAIDRAIKVRGLSLSLRGSLKKYPGCVHWHVRNGRESGTLEITWSPQRQRAWFSIQSARSAEWIEEAIEQLAQTVQRELKRL
jgi:hypothetical protein